MDLALHPLFTQNRTIYFTYSKRGERGDTPTLASARFDGARLTGVHDLFVADARPEIFAYGVRNPQGLFVEPSTGTIWEHEHGPRR